MKEITLSTNMHCGSCVAKLGKVLNEDKRVHHWSADVNTKNKLVTIHGNLMEDDAAALIQKAGFEAFAAAIETCEMPSQQQPDFAKQPALIGFWNDKNIWGRASFNTLNCLIGCSIGDFGMIIFLQVYYPGTPMWLQMLLAIIAGLLTSIILETSILHLKEKLVWKAALKMALSMSFISMVAMEVAMNATDFMITGGKAQLTSIYYWLAFVPAAIAGFLVPLPYNYFKLKKYNQACH